MERFRPSIWNPAIAQVAYRFQTPCLIIRSISDIWVRKTSRTSIIDYSGLRKRPENQPFRNSQLSLKKDVSKPIVFCLALQIQIKFGEPVFYPRNITAADFLLAISRWVSMKWLFKPNRQLMISIPAQLDFQNFLDSHVLFLSNQNFAGRASDLHDIARWISLPSRSSPIRAKDSSVFTFFVLKCIKISFSSIVRRKSPVCVGLRVKLSAFNQTKADEQIVAVFLVFFKLFGYEQLGANCARLKHPGFKVSFSQRAKYLASSSRDKTSKALRVDCPD